MHYWKFFFDPIVKKNDIFDPFENKLRK